MCSYVTSRFQLKCSTFSVVGCHFCVVGHMSAVHVCYGKVQYDDVYWLAAWLALEIFIFLLCVVNDTRVTWFSEASVKSSTSCWVEKDTTFNLLHQQYCWWAGEIQGIFQNSWKGRTVKELHFFPHKLLAEPSPYIIPFFKARREEGHCQNRL